MSDWPTLPLRALVEQRRSTVHVRPGIDYPLLGVRWYGAGAFVRETVREGSTSAVELQPARPGDLMYNRLFAWKQSFALLTQVHAGCYASNEFPMFKVKGAVDGRFLLYSLLRDEVSAVIDSESTGATAISRNRWPEDRFRNLVIPVPALEEQRRIADFLDEQVACIDAVILDSKRQGALFAEQLDARREEAVTAAAGAKPVPLGRLVDPQRPITYGIVQAGPDVAGGVPYIKTGDMADFRPELLSRCSPDVEAAYTRSRVRPGDLVIAMRASIGATVVVPPELSLANLTQGTARIAAGTGIDRGWLYEALVSPFVQGQMQMKAVGSTFRTLNLWDLARVTVPTPPRAVMLRLGRSLARASATARNAQRAERDRRRLLQERKRALITAAVTGEFDVSSAGSRATALVTV